MKVQETLDRVDRALQWRGPWWVWPSVLVLAAVLSLVAALTLHAGPDEFTYLPGGQRLGDTCAFLAVTGQPCPQCGMTRSWVWAARGELLTALRYSPGGATLFLWVQAGGIVGLARLLGRDPNRLEPPWQALVGWTVVWLVFLYALPWVLRLSGINPLP